MLVLRVKTQEGVTIGGGIRVIVLRTLPDQVRIGIDAPEDIPVYREEIYKKIVKQNQEAAEKNYELKELAKLKRPEKPTSIRKK